MQNSTTLDRNYAMLSFGGQLIGLPQNDVVTVELASGAMQIKSHEHAVSAAIEYENEEWPVFCLNSDLRVTLDDLRNHHFCVCFGRDEDKRFALFCDEVSILRAGDATRLHPMPEYLSIGDMPLAAVALIDEHLVALSDYERMGKYLRSVEKPDGQG